MAITGVDMAVALKKQSALGTIASGASGIALRRVASSLNLKKQTYQSNEIATNYQLTDMRHGVRSVEGALQGELSPGAWYHCMQSALRRDFTSLTAASGLSITIAGSGPTYTVTRSAGSFLTDGFKLGHVIRLSAGSFNAANLAKNLMIVGLTATVATVVVCNGVALVAEGPIASSTVTATGKQTWCPATGHTKDFYTIEHWMSSLSLSESYWDCVIGGMNIALPGSGLATVEFPVMGLDLTTAASQALTSPTAATTKSVTAAVNGVLRSSAGALANITGITLNLTNNCAPAGPVVGSNKNADIVCGRHIVSGQLTALFDSATLRDYFINETEVGLYLALTSDGTAAADFVAIAIDRIKLGACDRDDSEGVKTATIPFSALFNSAGGTGINTEATTLRVQDSAAP